MVITSEKGALVITGCSHPGLRRVFGVALSNFGRVYAVIGGFHGFNDFSLLKGMGFICPCHCTQHKQKIAELFPKTYTKCRVGKVIEI